MTLLGLVGEADAFGVVWAEVDRSDVNGLLRSSHYLGAARSARFVFGGFRDGELVAAQVYRHPTARHLPGDLLELTRWCLTPEAGPSAGSRMHAAAVPFLRRLGAPAVVSYSDPSVGHTGALYRACNWLWAPTWHRLRPPPSGLGSWDGETRQEVKDRWVFPLRRRLPAEVVDAFTIDDRAAVRRFLSGEVAVEAQRWRPLIPWDYYRARQ